MAENRRSIGSYLMLTAWESWSVEPHWRNAVIIAVVGTIAVTINNGNSSSPVSPPPTASAPTASQPTAAMQQAIQSGNASFVAPVSTAPKKFKPAISSDEVEINIIETTPAKKQTFARSYGE